MSKIRIYSKKAFAIGPGAPRDGGPIESFITVPGSFQDMPEEYISDPTFILASKVGDITVVDSKNIENTIPNSPVVPNESSELSVEKKFYDELKLMKGDDLSAMADKYKVTYSQNEKTSEIKKRIFEAFKLTLTEDNSDEDK